MEQVSGSESRKKGKPGCNKGVKKLYDCIKCQKSFLNRHDLIRHDRLHTGEKPFHCDLCPRSFSRKGNMERHRKQVHFPEQVLKIPCPDCGKSFSTKANLLQHQLIHQGRMPFTCVFCPKKVRHATGLRLHLKRHLLEKGYFCKYCDQSYFTKDNLKYHHSGHTGDKRFKCPHPNCSIAFWDRPLLIAHRRQFHKEDIGVAYLCIFCDNGIEFVRKQELDTHLRRHIGEKWYSCKDCDKRFVTASELNDHSNRIHHKDGEKKYRCYECDMMFYSSAQLRSHRRRTHRNQNAGD